MRVGIKQGQRSLCYAYFPTQIFDFYVSSFPKSSSHRQGKLGSAELLSKFDLIILLSASSLGSGIYNHVLVCSIPPRRVNPDPILSTKDTPIFGADSGHYVPKSRCWPWRNLLGKGQIWGMNSRIIVWTLRSLWQRSWVFRLASPPSGRHQRVFFRGLLPVLNKTPFSLSSEDFNPISSLWG